MYYTMLRHEQCVTQGQYLLRVRASLISVFFHLVANVKKPSLPYYLSIAEGRGEEMDS